MKKKYLIQCGDYISLTSDTSFAAAAMGCMDNLFENKELKISPMVIVLEVKKCLRSLDLLGSMEFFSLPKLLEDNGKPELAESVKLMEKHFNG